MAVLTEKIRAFLAEKRFPVLATIGADGLPQQSVMWYELQGDQIMMNTKRGRVKEQNLRRDQRVSLCFEDGYNYLTIVGKVELIDTEAIAQADISHLAERYHGQGQAQEMIARFKTEQRVTIRLNIEKVIDNLG